MFIAGVDEGAAEGDVAAYYESQRASWGFLPNYAAAFSHRPEVAQAWQALNLAIRGGMDRRRYEIATIAAARARHSTYCTVAHSLFLRDVCDDEEAMRSITVRPDGSGLEEEDRAVYEFATAVATDASQVAASDVERLRAVGLSDAEIADVTFAAAARCFFAAVLDGLGAQLDPETAAAFPADLLDAMVVGRPVADGLTEPDEVDR
ncbi:carboxymuconolactone decarboxylase family protein [Intrasporangium sp.]|uniref:carboxymuconolactone decarboxylase family protein n=1 Tax=Intrasporangium sp. TaxID=1925024 RepID=UPI002939ECDA|nr:carboxymuconolactone decarboxylase family protein [Intrasporangium sp.]MDV3222778.1 carboxymuconolactone decarboxylase family protein [Intrasporangium sp.]